MAMLSKISQTQEKKSFLYVGNLDLRKEEDPKAKGRHFGKRKESSWTGTGRMEH